jgi:uncharacterized protein YuzE
MSTEGIVALAGQEAAGASDRIRSMRFSYDPEADAASIHLVEGYNAVKQVVVRDEQLWQPVVIDLDSEGHVIGFEFLDASETLPARLLDEFR